MTTISVTPSLHDALPISERVRTEGRGDRDIRRVAAPREQHPADARDVVARVENVPLTAEIDFEPGREIHRRDRKSTRLNSSHRTISYAVFCLKIKNKQTP